jgi:hypothetical protein
MDMMKHYAFLNSIRDYIATNPEVAPYVADYARAGLEAQLKEQREKAVHLEVLVCALAGKRFDKQMRSMAASKLRKLDAQQLLCLDPESMIRELES